MELVLAVLLGHAVMHRLGRRIKQITVGSEAFTDELEPVESSFPPCKTGGYF